MGDADNTRFEIIARDVPGLEIEDFRFRKAWSIEHREIQRAVSFR